VHAHILHLMINLRLSHLLGLAVALTVSCNALANSERDAQIFPSQVRGLTIMNAHKLQGSRYVYRGSAPLGRAQELKALGVQKVLIFKNQTRGEVDREIKELTAAGYAPEHIHSFDFLWRDIESFELACEQTVEALQILIAANQAKQKIFFHCTAGQDRTGYLAALYRYLREGADLQELVASQMCSKGYAEGNPNKPYTVVKAINENLSPLFLALAAKIKSGELSVEYLDKNVCRDIEVEKAEISLCRDFVESY
jgi:hypothetical protein